MSNREFGDADFIDASRQLVCVRPDTYENEVNQKIVRRLLGGTLQNTAFCILSPDGTKELSQTGRGLTRDVRGAAGLDLFALQYSPKGDLADAFTPDFDSFRMALNIASADSRLLVVVVADQQKQAEVEKRMRLVAWNDDIVGRFHFDFVADGSKLTKPLSLSDSAAVEGIYFVRPGEFGVDGQVMQRLPLDSDTDKVIASLKQSNEQYAKTTKTKTYSQHVAAGRNEGYFFEMPMVMGEDRDGDGTPDSTRRIESAKAKAKRSGKFFPGK